MPKISVIIPNYNHATFLLQRVDSVLQQSVQDFELILLDDASTDNSRTIIEKYRHHDRVKIIIYNDTNSGSPFLQWEKGLKHCTGKWIWIAESDDIASPLFLEKMLAIAGKVQPAFVYCDSAILNENGVTNLTFAQARASKMNTSKWLNPYHIDGKIEINEALKWECVVNNAAAVLFNRELLQKHISAIRDFQYHGDWMLYLLMAENGQVSYTPEILNTYREHDGSHTGAEKPFRRFKVEHFRILHYLLERDFVTEKKALFRHFVKRFTGFGLWSEPAFGKNGIMKEYAAINQGLAKKTLRAVLMNKLVK